MTEKKLLSVDEALARILRARAPSASPKTLPLAKARGRTLASDLIAKRTQPPDRCFGDGWLCGELGRFCDARRPLAAQSAKAPPVTASMAR